MDSLALVERIKQDPRYKGQIVHIESIPPKQAVYADYHGLLLPKVAGVLEGKGIDRLFSHQVQALEATARGENVVVVTPTASGKTMCYNLPVLNHLLLDQEARALYLFPTKSLSQDQLAAIQEFNLPVKAAVYDGDTPESIKAEIRENHNVVITNPDMVHLGILPNHLKWHAFFSNLKYVVIDELHTYRGVFGSHVSHILRRLRRVCRHYGSDPQFIMASATIANPQEHAERLLGLPVTLIDNNGAPQGAKHFVLWRPPVNRPYLADVVWLLETMLKLRRRTIVFSRARQTTERILRQTRQMLQDHTLRNKIVSYRGGYLAQERRQIETALFNGQVYAVVSTNALELGVDVGDLEVCIIAGFPGTIASTWQQAGRVGRRQKDSLVIFIGVENPLDQHFIRHKDALFTTPKEHALIDPENPYILLGHALCACHELPVTTEDFPLWGSVFQNLLVLLEEDGEIVCSEGKYYYMGQSYPAQRVNVRTSSQETYHLRDRGANNRLVGVMDGQRAFSEVYPGAVYMHLGETYVVRELDLENKTALLDKNDVDYYTMVKRNKETEILEVQEEKWLHHNRLFTGTLKVTTKVTGYIKKHESTGQVVGAGELDLPEQTLETVGMWITVNDDITETVKQHRLNLMGGLHAIEHAAIGLLPLFAMCDRNDIGGLSTVLHRQTQMPTIFIHDGYDGGVGFSEMAYQHIEDLLEKTMEAIMECECDEGCPRCIYSPKCSNFNRPLDKEAAIFILHKLLGRDYVPRPPEEEEQQFIHKQNLQRVLSRLK